MANTAVPTTTRAPFSPKVTPSKKNTKHLKSASGGSDAGDHVKKASAAQVAKLKAC